MVTVALARPGFVETPEARLHYLLWQPDAPRARIVLLHGLESHSAWFTDLGPRLAALGHIVIAIDRPGAGRSGGPRGDAGPMQGLFGYLRLVLGAVSPPLPTYLIGFSWGARWALAQAIRHPGDARGVVMMAPGLHLLTTYSPMRRSAILATALCRPATRMPTPVREHEWFTTRPAPLAFIQSDPWRLSRVTSRLLLRSWLLERVYSRRAHVLRIPLLHLMGGRDRICDNRRNRRLLQRAAGTGLYAEHLYADADHALMFECDRYPIADDIATWIAASAS